MIILPLQSCSVKQLGKIQSPKFSTTKTIISYLNIRMMWLSWFVRSKVVRVVIVSNHSVVWNDTIHINLMLKKKVTYSELNCRNVITTNFSHPSFVENKSIYRTYICVIVILVTPSLFWHFTQCIMVVEVKSFKYLGSIVNGNNSIEEEIKGRISLGNKAFYANQDLFKSKLLTKNSKLRMYKTLVRQTSGNICLWNLCNKRKHKNQTKGIWEEGTKNNLMDPLKKRMAHGGLNWMKN